MPGERQLQVVLLRTVVVCLEGVAPDVHGRIGAGIWYVQIRELRLQQTTVIVRPQPR